ncbi:hypothetical protein [uncultured Devosia sp.]|nr:hypothetical protein [uncultured Devosia sp.]
MNPGGIIWRAANWLARGQNAFVPLIFTLVPPLLAITMMGFFR